VLCDHASTCVDEQEAKVPTPLTDLESHVLDYLFEYLRRNTYQPSIREIGARFSIKSTKTVSELLQSLADKGWIERDPSRSRGVRLLGMEMTPDIVSVPLIDATGSGGDGAAFQIDRRLAGRAGVFLVRMQGDHLLEDGIRAGDLLLVEPVSVDTLQTGDLVVADIGGRTTARRCLREPAQFILEPATGEQQSTAVTVRQAALTVRGVVAGVVRRLRPVAEHASVAIAPAG
jgi:repressor LexA